MPVESDSIGMACYYDPPCQRKEGAVCTVGATAASNSAAVEEQRKIMPYDPENGVGEVIPLGD